MGLDLLAWLLKPLTKPLNKKLEEFLARMPTQEEIDALLEEAWPEG